MKSKDVKSRQNALQKALENQKKIEDLIAKADYQTAIKLGTHAIEVFREKEEWNNCIQLRCLIAKSYAELAQIEMAKNHLEETLQLGKKHLKEEDILIGDIYYQFGYLYGQVLKDSFSALPYFHKAFEIHKKKYGYTHTTTANNINNIGFCYWLKGDYENALKYMEEALKVYKTVENHKWSMATATVANNIGACYIEQGDVKRGLLFIKESLAAKLEHLPSNHPSIAQSYNNIGVCYNKLNQGEQSDEYFHKVLKIRLKKYGEVHPMVAVSYTQLGINFHKRKDYKNCLHYNQKALEIQKKTIGENHFQTGVTLKTIADAYRELGEFDHAIEYFNYALNTFLQSLGVKHLLVAHTYRDLSLSHFLKENYLLAFQYIQKALQPLFANEDIGQDIHQPIPQAKSNLPLRLLKVLHIKGKILLEYFNKQPNELQYSQTAIDTYTSAQRIIRELQKSYLTIHSKLLLSDDVMNIYEGSIKAALSIGKENSTQIDLAFTLHSRVEKL